MSTLFICLYAASALAIVPMIIVSILAMQIRKYYMKTQREMVRFEKITNSPIVSGFMSSINGLSSIRAYKMQNIFLENQIQTTNSNKRVRLSKAGLENWFCNVLGFLSYLVNMPCIGYCMFSNNSSPALMGLLMVYALSLSDCMVSLTLASTYFETKLVSL
jgi:ATP-binding cassette, subfamily C (CFTR/MRP), member 1